MKRKLSLILLTMGMVAPLLAGCPAKGDTPTPTPDPEEEKGHPSPDIETPESIDLDYFDIDPVDKTTHTFTKEEILELMHADEAELVKDEEQAEMFAKMFNDAKVSLEQVNLIVEVFFGSELASIYNPESIKAIIEKVLALINSLSGEQIASLLTSMNEFTKQDAKAKYNEADYELVNYFSNQVKYCGVGYDMVDDYKEVADGESKGEDSFKRASEVLSTMKEAMENYVFTEAMKEEAAKAKAEAQKEMTEDVIPSYVIEYAKKSGESLIKTLTKYIEATGCIVIGRLSEMMEGYYAPGRGTEIQIVGYRSVEPINIFEIISGFTLTDVKDILKAVMGKAEDNKVVFELARKIVLPLIFEKEVPTEDTELKAKRQEFMNALNALEITAFDNLTKFLIAGVDTLNDEDVAVYTGTDLEAMVTNMKAKIPGINLAIQMLDEYAKAQISKFFELCGIDFFKTLNDAMVYVQNAVVTTDDEKQAFVDHFKEVGDEISAAFNENVAPLFSNESEVYQTVSVNYNSPHPDYFVVGEEASIDAFSYINVYSHAAHGASSTGIDVSRMKDFTLDTSKAGFVTGELSYVDEEDNPFTLEFDVRVEPATRYNIGVKTSRVYGDDGHVNEWNIDHMEAVDNYPEVLNIYYHAYFGAIPAEDFDHEIISYAGLYVAESEDFETTPRVEDHFSIDVGYGYKFSDYNYYELDIENIGTQISQEDGMHEFTYLDHTFEYETINNPTKVDVHYEVPQVEFEYLPEGTYETFDGIYVEISYYNAGEFVEGDVRHKDIETLHLTNVKHYPSAGTLSFEYEGLTYLYKKS